MITEFQCSQKGAPLTGARFTGNDTTLVVVVEAKTAKCGIGNGEDVWRQRTSTDHVAVLLHHLQHNKH